jgi:hypothetical protein
VRGRVAQLASADARDLADQTQPAAVVRMNVRAMDRGLLSRITIPLAAVVMRRQFRGHDAVLSRVLEEDRRAWSDAT